MNKTILALLLMCICVTGITACSKKNSIDIPKNNTPTKIEEKVEPKTEEKLEDKTEVKTEVKIESRKQEFKNKLDKLDEKLSSSEEAKKADAGVTYDMLNYGGKQYAEWDKILNEIYNILKQQLPTDEMKKLQIEEIKWIAEKDTKAKKAALEFKGGTFENVAYTNSLVQTTQVRCYELVDKYMK